MKVKIIRDTVAGGQPEQVGQVVELPEAEASFLISIRKAVSLESEKIETADMPTDQIETAVRKPRVKRG